MRNDRPHPALRGKRIALSWLGMPLLAGLGALVPAVTVLATANTWTSLAPMAGGPRGDLGAATGADGRIYAIGGFASTWLDRVEAYDTVANTWSAEAPMPGAGGASSRSRPDRMGASMPSADTTARRLRSTGWRRMTP